MNATIEFSFFITSCLLLLLRNPIGSFCVVATFFKVQCANISQSYLKAALSVGALRVCEYLHEHLNSHTPHAKQTAHEGPYSL